MEDKNFKIRMVTIAILALIFVILVVCLISMYYKIQGMHTSTYVPRIENEVATPTPTKIIEEDEETSEMAEKIDRKDVNNYELSLKFLKLENKNDNFIFSPLSIGYALELLNEGASGETKEQISNVLGDTKFVKHENIKEVLSLANALFIRDTFAENVKSYYKNLISNKYNAELKIDDFKSANNINNWIEDKTLGQIKNLLSDNDITDPSNVMTIVNALAIDMKWENEFETTSTYSNDFYLANGSKIEATTMHRNSKEKDVSYYIDDNITVLSMNLQKYENEQMEFIAIMPKDNLSEYISNFNEKTIKTINSKLSPASNNKSGINISIPKFSFDYFADLNNDLKTLGIEDAFSATKANFSGISDKPLYVSDALHKANIDFSEKGVKAAAVTVMMVKMNAAIMQEKPIEIKIDKPFMFIIKDKGSDEIWFMGAVYNPNLWENDKAEYNR